MQGRAIGLRTVGVMLALSWVLIWVASPQAADAAATNAVSAQQAETLGLFTNGVGNGMHVVYTHANFDALMRPDGYLMIYPKDKGQRIGQPLVMGLYAYYVNEVDQIGRPMVSFKDARKPLTNPATVELTGKLTDDVDYCVTFTFEKNVISVRGYGKDPAGIKFPTTFRMGVSVPPYCSFPPDTPQAERAAKLRGLAFMTRTGQKQASYPYASGALMVGPVEKCWISGPVYGARRLSFEGKSPETAPMQPYVYPYMAPHSGYFIGIYKSDRESKKIGERFTITIQ